MLVLLTYRSQHTLDYKIIKLYQKKASLQIAGKISVINNKIVWELINSQNQVVERNIIDQVSIRLKQFADSSIYAQIVQNEHLSVHNFDLIVHKIYHGGDEYDNISVLSHHTLQKLKNFSYLAPEEQQADLSLAEVFLDYFPNAKHYACYETGFHQSIELNSRMLFPDWVYLKHGIKNYGSHGLTFLGLTDKLSSLADKKLAKGKWIYLYLSEEDNTLCAIKNSKSIYCSSSSLHHEIPSSKYPGEIDPNLISLIADHFKIDIAQAHNTICATNLFQAGNNEFNELDALLNSQSPMAKLAREYYINSIIETFMQQASLLEGVDGIIFTGKAGYTNPKLRQLICNKLEWLGIHLSNKSNLDNNCKLNKKSSNTLIFTLPPDPFSAMLNQLFERI